MGPSGRLALHPRSDQRGVLARHRLEAAQPDRFGLSAQLELGAPRPGSGFTIRVRDDLGTLAKLRVSDQIGGGVRYRQLDCVAGGYHRQHRYVIRHDAAPQQLAVTADSSTTRTHCALNLNGDYVLDATTPASSRRRSAVGELWLEVRSDGDPDWVGPLHAQAVVGELSLHGLAPAPTPINPVAAAHHDLARGRTQRALSAYRSLPDAQRWAVWALLDLGDTEGAVDAVARGAVSAHDLPHLLARHGPALGPGLRSRWGDRFFDAYGPVVWARHLAHPQRVDDHLQAHLAAPPDTPTGRRVALVRGLAAHRAGLHDLATRSLHPLATAPEAVLRQQAARALAYLALDIGDVDAARRHVGDALAAWGDAAVGRDALSAEPMLAPLLPPSDLPAAVRATPPAR